MPGFAVRRRCRSYHRWAFPFHSFTMPRHSWPCVAITLIYASHFCCSSHPCNTFLVLRRSIQRSPAANHSAPTLLLHMAPRGYANALRLYSLLLLCLCAAWLRFAITSQGFSIPSHIACWMRVSARWMRVNWRTTPADAVRYTRSVSFLLLFVTYQLQCTSAHSFSAQCQYSATLTLTVTLPDPRSPTETNPSDCSAIRRCRCRSRSPATPLSCCGFLLPADSRCRTPPMRPARWIRCR